MPGRPKKRKLEELVLASGLAEDASRARAMIMAGQVVVSDQRVDKPGQLVSETALIRLKSDTSPFVSRGGEKLAFAMEDFGLLDQWRDTVVMDIGSSTGGFTDVCLQKGARRVIAVDVGTNQLAWRLRQDPRVEVYEQTDIRGLKLSPVPVLDWIVADVSFISLRVVIKDLLRFATAERTRCLLLVKPQFELPKELVPEGGVVLSEDLRQQALGRVLDGLREVGITNVETKDSRLPGKEGNREFFVYFRAPI